MIPVPNQFEESSTEISQQPENAVEPKLQHRIVKFLKGVFLPPLSKTDQEGIQRISRRSFLTYTAETIAALAAGTAVAQMPRLSENVLKVDEVSHYSEEEFATRFKQIFEQKIQEWMVKVRAVAKPELSEKYFATLDVDLYRNGTHEKHSVGKVADIISYSTNTSPDALTYEALRKGEQNQKKRQEILQVLQQMRQAFEEDRLEQNPGHEQVREVSYYETSNSYPVSKEQALAILSSCVTELQKTGVVLGPPEAIMSNHAQPEMYVQTKSLITFQASDKTITLDFSIGFHGEDFPVNFSVKKVTTIKGNSKTSDYTMEDFFGDSQFEPISRTDQEFMSLLYTQLEQMVTLNEQAPQ